MLTTRPHFPIFKSHPNLVYLDSAATTQKPNRVIDAVAHFYRTSNANVHRGMYELAQVSTQLFETTREQVAQFIKAESSREIIFTHSTTEALNLLAWSLTDNLEPGDEIILSELEHHANLVPWQQAAKRKNLVLKFIQVTDRGELDMENATPLITERTKLVSVAHISNVTGTLTPIADLKKLLVEQGSEALLVVDAAQSAPHLPLSVKELGCDFLTFSAHKLYGPSGVGILWGKAELLATLPPYQTGGNMINTVSLQEATWNEVPWKFEAGTPCIEGVVGLGAALEYMQELGFSHISQHTTELSLYTRERLQDIPGVQILGDPNPLSGIISFTVAGIHPHDLASMLGDQEICIRAGHHCAAPLHTALTIAASNRVSIGVYTTTDDINRFLKALNGIINDFSRV